MAPTAFTFYLLAFYVVLMHVGWAVIARRGDEYVVAGLNADFKRFSRRYRVGVWALGACAVAYYCALALAIWLYAPERNAELLGPHEMIFGAFSRPARAAVETSFMVTLGVIFLCYGAAIASMLLLFVDAHLKLLRPLRSLRDDRCTRLLNLVHMYSQLKLLPSVDRPLVAADYLLAEKVIEQSKADKVRLEAVSRNDRDCATLHSMMGSGTQAAGSNG